MHTTEIAVDRFGGMHEMTASTRRSQSRGEFLADPAGLAHAGRDDTPPQLQDALGHGEEGVADALRQLANGVGLALDDLASAFDPGVHQGGRA